MECVLFCADERTHIVPTVCVLLQPLCVMSSMCGILGRVLFENTGILRLARALSPLTNFTLSYLHFRRIARSDRRSLSESRNEVGLQVSSVANTLSVHSPFAVSYVSSLIARLRMANVLAPTAANPAPP